MRLFDLLRRGAIDLVARPEALLSASFIVLILLTTGLLMLPLARAGQPISLLDALFTSTSAACVTGLTVVDTGTAFSRLGQSAILVEIQCGGLGIMAFAALAAQLLGGRLSFRSQAVLADSFYQREAASALRRNLKWIISVTLLFELAGALLLYPGFCAQPGPHPPWFSAMFHAVSAFCNAGFGLWPDSLVPFRANVLMVATVMVLIVAGGLGHAVLLEMFTRVGNRLRGRMNYPVRWSLNSRVVLSYSAVLIVGGAAALLVFGSGGDGAAWWDAPLAALFQSITARTAGFNTVDVGALPTTSLLILIGLMFVGGSPASCAGGIKTTSAAVWLANLRARLTASDDVTLLGRALPIDLVGRATLIIGLALVWNAVGCLLLALTEAPRQLPLEVLLFEQISAFGTVGLSTGITPGLSVAGKLWIIATMFVGRVGPLAAALMFAAGQGQPVRYPQERLMVG